MIVYKLVKNNQKSNNASYGKWYARPVITETVDLDGLAEHMANHNSPYSKGVITGILTDMVQCIKELLLDSKAVRIDNLAIFSVGIVNSCGCAVQADYHASEYIDNVKLRARATGELAYSKLNLDATLKRSALDKNEEVPEVSDDEIDV
jgi:hypothetical protein